MSKCLIAVQTVTVATLLASCSVVGVEDDGSESLTGTWQYVDEARDASGLSSSRCSGQFTVTLFENNGAVDGEYSGIYECNGRGGSSPYSSGLGGQIIGHRSGDSVSLTFLSWCKATGGVHRGGDEVSGSLGSCASAGFTGTWRMIRQ